MYGQSVTVALWRRRWTALAVLVLTLAATVLWLALAPTRYTAIATVTATPQSGSGPSADGAKDLVNTVAGLADSRPVLQDVRDSTGVHRSLTVMQREVRAERVRETVLIRIRVTDGSPVIARRLANAVADALPLHDPTGGKFVFTDAGRAVTPHAPSSPDVAEGVLLGLGAGVVLALLGALLHAGASSRVDRPGQVAALAGTEVLGVVDRPAGVDAAVEVRPGPATDEFRRVRIALEFAGSVAPTRTIVLSSVGGDPAAGWLAVNLAAALAEVQHRVLLVDADFTGRPRHRALAGKGDGLVDVLAGRADPADAITSSEVPGVSVLAVGGLENMAPAALVEQRFHAFLAEISADDFDVVLVHAAPLRESDDARVMAVGHSLLLAVPLRGVRATELRRAVSDVRHLRLRLLGAVLIGPQRKP